MPINRIQQPNVIEINDQLRLVSFPDNYEDKWRIALKWYQDLDTIWLLDGNREPYDLSRLSQMFHWLNDHGELYFIEVQAHNNQFYPIGDVTFSKEDMPIIIWDPAYRGQGIASQVIKALMARGRDLGYKELFVEEIYHWNKGSQKTFMNLGFYPYQETDRGWRYRVELT